MNNVLALVACLAVFAVYGLFCLAMGWRNLGGAIPLIGLMAAELWLFRYMTSEPEPKKD